MKNLAGVETADDVIKLELKAAGIPICKFFGQHKHEVPWTYEGKLFGWTFRRAWYYWVADGRLPLPVAQYIYNRDTTRAVRVAGHCGAPPPERPWTEEYDSKGYGIFQYEPEPPAESCMKQIYDDILLRGSYDSSPEMNASYRYVTGYHIDSQDGLNLFVEAIKKYEKLAYAAAVNIV
jgi:hypothetical protein